MGKDIPQEDNNIQNGETSTDYDQKYINQSLRDFAFILYDYVIGQTKNEEE